MMASFAPIFIDQRFSYFNGVQCFSMSSSGGCSEDSSFPKPQHSDNLPFVLCPSTVDLYKEPLRGSGPRLLPFLPAFHHHGHFSVYECPFEPAFIQKRNERERQRVRCVNLGYAKLRQHLPGQDAERRLSKVETLRAAIRYIKYLQGLVSEDGPNCLHLPTPRTEGAKEQDQEDPRFTS